MAELELITLEALKEQESTVVLPLKQIVEVDRASVATVTLDLEED